jgi:hypothetical protein
LRAQEDDMKFSNLVSVAVAAAFAVAMVAAPAAARTGNTKVKTKVPAASAKPKPVKAPKTSNAAKAKPPKAKPAGATKPQTSSSGAAAKSNKSTKTASKPTTSSQQGTDAKPVTGTNDLEPTPAEPGPTLPLSKAQEKLLKNENLRAKMAARLGRDPLVAASGFKNLGQFVAAVNVSNNLGIDFNMLKRLMVGRGLSLGQAIQQAKAMDATGATRIANQAVLQADADISAGVN